MIIEIHVAPNPPGTDESRYEHIEAAIAEAQDCCLNYEVGALGTTVEGPDDELWALLRRMHEATLKSGASSVITNVRIAQQAEDDGPQMKKLVAPFRPGE
jgi:uncharacterized protein YqgV (UPF0045/DUF77 family)